MVIKISQKIVDKWNAWDFVKFFLSHFRDAYMNQTYLLNHARDGMIMKRIINKFRKHGKSKEAVALFIVQVFREYQSNELYTEPLTIAFLPSWIDQHLHIKPEKKKKERQPPQLSESMKSWIKRKRDNYEPDYGKRRRQL